MSNREWSPRIAHRRADEMDMEAQGKVREKFTATITIEVDAYGKDDAIDRIENVLYWAKQDGAMDGPTGLKARLLRRSVKVKGT
jgi:hypothetical protein